MKVRFTTLPDTLSGAAWPSSSLEGNNKMPSWNDKVRAVKAFLRELPLLPKGFSEKLDIKGLRQRCHVKSCNEQDPCPMLRRGQFGFGTHRGPLLIKQRKVRSTAGQYGPNPLGYTRPTMVGTMGCHSEID